MKRLQTDAIDMYQAYGDDPATPLAWLMARHGITAPIASATSVEQVRELLDAATVQLTPAEVAALYTVSA